jgi:hypothetical protein
MHFDRFAVATRLTAGVLQHSVLPGHCLSSLEVFTEQTLISRNALVAGRCLVGRAVLWFA